ncbi:MAG: helix-turn-helix transcriptional regulator [Clostridia bacterium]|nr:helix-turn-helix transcriptional regulator [Clostridia bacterium]
MAFYESRAQRNGVPMSVQYILLEQNENSHEARLHYHEYAELLFGISGKCRVVVGGEVYELSEGEMVLIYPNDPHDVTSAGEKCVYHVVKFLPQVLMAGEQSSSEYGYVFLLMEQLRERQMLFGKSELEKSDVPMLFERMRQEWCAQNFGYELSLRADVTKLFLYILRKWSEQNPDLTEDYFLSAQSELMQRVLMYIQKHYADLTEEETAIACGVSAPYLSRSFKKSMKTSFSSYVTEVRLRESEKLLLTTDESITDIAQTVGFSTSAYYIAKFRERYGITPHRYRTVGKG